MKLLYAWCLAVLLVAIVGGSAPAAEVEVWSQEARVQSEAAGVALIITDFWDKPVEFAFSRLRGGRWTYLVKHKGIFRVQARDLTAEELRDLEVEARLQALEKDLEAVRGQVGILCDRLRWRAPGCAGARGR